MNATQVELKNIERILADWDMVGDILPESGEWKPEGRRPLRILTDGSNAISLTTLHDLVTALDGVDATVDWGHLDSGCEITIKFKQEG